MTDWCPENDGAYRMELEAMHRDQTADRIAALTAERDALAEKLALAVEAGKMVLDQADDLDKLAIPALLNLHATLAAINGDKTDG